MSRGPGGGTCPDVFCGCFECLASSFKPFSVSSGGGDLLMPGLSASTRHILEQICDPSLPCFSALVAVLRFGINITPCTSAPQTLSNDTDQRLLLSRLLVTRWGQAL